MTRDEFDAAWDEFFGALRRARGRASAEVEREGITLPQYHLLVSGFADRGRGDAVPVGALAGAAGIAQPTATRMLDSLEREGMVKREASTEDRRRVVVALTNRGRRVVEKKKQLVDAKRAALYRSLPREDRERAADLLRRLAAVIEEPQ